MACIECNRETPLLADAGQTDQLQLVCEGCLRGYTCWFCGTRLHDSADRERIEESLCLGCEREAVGVAPRVALYFVGHGELPVALVPSAMILSAAKRIVIRIENDGLHVLSTRNTLGDLGFWQQLWLSVAHNGAFAPNGVRVLHRLGLDSLTHIRHVRVRVRENR